MDVLKLNPVWESQGVVSSGLPEHLWIFFKITLKILWAWTCYPLPHHKISLHFLSKHFLEPWTSNWENWDFFNASAVFQLMEESDTALRSALSSMFITLFSALGCAQIFLLFPVVRLAKSHLFSPLQPLWNLCLTFLFWALNVSLSDINPYLFITWTLASPCLL